MHFPVFKKKKKATDRRGDVVICEMIYFLISDKKNAINH